MKKVFILSVFLLISGFALLAQAPIVPPSSASQTGTGPVGGGAPIGTGIILVISLTAGFVWKKAVDERKKLAE